MPSKLPPDVESLIDAVIDAAASCVRHKMFLQAIDWKRVDGQKVRNLLERLRQEKVALPAWLAKALLIGGHSLSADHQEKLDPALRALNRLNSSCEDNSVAPTLEELVLDLPAQRESDSEVAAALVEALSSRNHGALAVELALNNWHQAPKAMRAVQDNLAAHIDALQHVKLRVLGFSTVHMLAQDFVPAFAAFGYCANVEEGDFGTVISELLKTEAPASDAIALFMDLEGFYARDWRLPSDKSSALLMEKLDNLTLAIETFSQKDSRPVLINTLPAPVAPTAGFIDGQHQNGETRNIGLINQRLADIAAHNSHVSLVNSDVALTNFAPIDRNDPKLWFYGRLPYSADASRALAHGFAHAWHATKNGIAKVLALDLDNTLWGGTIGEDGVEALACGDEFPGNAFKAFQNECLRLKGQGMLLALLSKNNPDAIQAFKTHPGMVLREEDFVSKHINWEAKPKNILSLAKELNLGLDSFIFLDDSPHEREAMRRLCPDVRVPELPEDPAQRPRWLRKLSNTWPARLTEEDSRRSDMYVAERKATALRAKTVSFEDYLSGLEQRLIVEQVSSKTLPRAAQMHMRTNQFNLTTQRYDEADIKAMMADDGRYAILLGRVEDKFGDHGIVICATVQFNDEGANLLSFLMSCRVVGREIEQAFLGEVLNFVKKRGICTVEGTYIPTQKNGMVRDFYERCGFSDREVNGEKVLWIKKLEEPGLPGSNFIEVHWDN